MKLLAAIFFTLFVSTGCLAQNLPEPTTQTSINRAVLLQDLIYPVVKIDRDRNCGSGFIIKGRYVITAAHVVADAEPEESIPVIVHEGRIAQIYQAKVIDMGPGELQDWAILQFTVAPPDSMSFEADKLVKDGLPIFSATIASPETLANLSPFDEVYAAGFPGRTNNPFVTFGLLGEDANGYGTMSANVAGGDSGGPLYLKSTHEVIGINVRIEISHNMPLDFANRYIKIETILERINKLPELK